MLLLCSNSFSRASCKLFISFDHDYCLALSSLRGSSERSNLFSPFLLVTFTCDAIVCTSCIVQRRVLTQSQASTSFTNAGEVVRSFLVIDSCCVVVNSFVNIRASQSTNNPVPGRSVIFARIANIFDPVLNGSISNPVLAGNP